MLGLCEPGLAQTQVQIVLVLHSILEPKVWPSLLMTHGKNVEASGQVLLFSKKETGAGVVAQR